MIYGYVRVSSITQNIDRQIEEMKEKNIDNKHIFVDYQSGKNFQRQEYQIMKKKLKKDDLLYIKSIDRLGRDYQMIINEWADLTKNIGINIVIIDMPLLDTRIDEKSLVGTFIADIVLQILSFVAQNERENIKQRQAEGIRISKAKDIHFGRKAIELPDNFEQTVKSYMTHKISFMEALTILKISRATFYKYSKSIRNKK